MNSKKYSGDKMQSERLLSICFQAIVAEYDRVAPMIERARIPFKLARAKQEPQKRRPLNSRDDMDNLPPQDISSHEGHALGDAYVWVLVNAREAEKFTPEKAADLAKRAIAYGANIDLHKGSFNAVAAYLKLSGYKALAGELDIVVNWPDDTSLKRHLGIDQSGEESGLIWSSSPIRF